MKILQISPQVPIPYNDGGRLSIHGITNGLFKRGHEVHFLCYRKQVEKNVAIKEMGKICIPYILDVQTENNRLNAFINLFSSIPYNITKFVNKKLAIALTNVLNKNKFDLIHIDHLHMGWIIDIVREFTTAPVILREHNLELKIMQRFAEYQSNPFLKMYALLQSKKFLIYEPKLCEKFDKCIMISEKDEQDLLALNSQIKTAVIPAGVESNFISGDSIGARKIKYSLFHLGPLNWLPNLDGLNWFVNYVFPSIVDKFPQTKLFVYSKGTEIFKVPAKFSNNIIVKGFVNDLWNELKDKQLGIVPLRIGSGIRLKILELLAKGHNVVSTSIGKEGIDLTDGKEIIIANTQVEFVNKILDFFKDKYIPNVLSENGIAKIREKYTWDIIAEKFEKEYFSLLK